MMWEKKRRCLMEKEEPFDDDDNHQIKDVINTLSLDSLAQIFMLLPVPERVAIEKVCSKWKEACQLAWHDIKKFKCGISIGRTYDNQILTQAYVKKIILRCGIYLNELAISKVCNSSIMPVVANHCKNLTRLEFEYNEESKINHTNHFIKAFEQLDKLESIKIKVIDFNCSMRQSFLSKIINSLREEINEIHLLFDKRCVRFQEPIFFNLKKFKNLHSLTLYYCNISKIIQELSKKITLVYLDLQYCLLGRSEFTMLNQFVNLEYITINLFNFSICNRTSNVTLNSVNSILDTCTNLRYLNIPCNIIESTNTLFKNSVNLEKLIYLKIFVTITDDLAMKIVKLCKNLECLFILLPIESYVLNKIIELNNLQCLELPKYQKVSDEFIILISNNCLKLKHLEMTYCTIVKSIDDKPLYSASVLVNLSKLKYLEYLNLKGLYYLKDNTIISIANNCKNLKYLNISGCKGITETAIIALTSLENLERLFINGNNSLTDICINKFKKLKQLNCYDCKKLTDDGIMQFIKNCPNLEYLDIRYIDNITIDTIIAANDSTKKRINDITLELFTDNSKLVIASKLIIKSQWLVVVYKP